MCPQLQRPAWEAYALARTAGHSESESYRRAYPNASNWKPLSRARHAKRLEADPRIAERLAELRSEAAQRNHVEADVLIQDPMEIPRSGLGAGIREAKKRLLRTGCVPQGKKAAQPRRTGLFPRRRGRSMPTCFLPSRRCERGHLSLD